MSPPITLKEAKEAERRARKHNLEVASAELDDINDCLEDMQPNVKSVCAEVVRLQAAARAEQRKRAREAAAAKAADKARVEKTIASHHVNMRVRGQHAKTFGNSSSKSVQNHAVVPRRTTAVPKKRKMQNLVPLVLETFPEDCNEKPGSSKQ
uniref:Uncharacterized protein n=1 Tax=Panagrellus redivivus TaxID=6233 RepID=A0A7E4ZS09_PANRE